MASQHQAVTLISVDLSWKMSCGIYLREISQEALMNLNQNICSEITLF